MQCTSILQLTSLLAVVLGSCLYLKIKEPEGYKTTTSRERALTALTGLREWGVFLIGIQSGAIGIMGFFAEKIKSDSSELKFSDAQLISGAMALILFGASIIVATFLLGAIPSLILRITEHPSPRNDFFHLKLFSHSASPYVGPMTGLQYFLFCIGMIAFACFIYFRLMKI